MLGIVQRLVMVVILGAIGTLGAVALALLFALPTWWLWNDLMPVIFGLPTIGFFQALGLNILCSLLFKGSTSATSSS